MIKATAVSRRFDAIGDRTPRWPFEVNSHSPTSGGLLSLGAVSDIGIAYDLVGERFGDLNNTPSFEASELGRIGRFNDSGRDAEAIKLTHLGSTALDGLNAFTILIVGKFIGSNSADEDTIAGQWGQLQGSNTPASQRILFRYDSNNNQLDLFIDNGSTMPGITRSVSIEDGKFHWLVARWDGSQGAILVDGIQQGASASMSGPLKSTSHSKVPEIMGGHNVTSVQTDSPRFEMKAWGLWDLALSDGEVWHLYDPATRWELESELWLPGTLAFPAAGGFVPYPRYAMTGGMQPMSGGMQ